MPPPTPLIGTAAITENMLKRRWSLIVLRHLHQGRNDPAEVVKLEAGLSPPVLNERLRTMVRYGLIARYPRPPPSEVIEYRLTARGRRILEMLNQIEQLDLEEFAVGAPKPAVKSEAPPPARQLPPAPEKKKSAPVKRTETTKRAKAPRRPVPTLLAMRTALTCLLALLSLTLPLAAADPGSAGNPGPDATETGRPNPAAILAGQVAEIAASSTLSHRTKAQRIGSAVSLAVVTATEGIKDSATVVQLAKELVEVAAQAAPDYTAAIVDAVARIPALAAIEGALVEIRAAAQAGLKAAGEDRPGAAFAPVPPAPPANSAFGGSSGEVIVSPSH